MPRVQDVVTTGRASEPAPPRLGGYQVTDRYVVCILSLTVEEVCRGGGQWRQYRTPLRMTPSDRRLLCRSWRRAAYACATARPTCCTVWISAPSRARCWPCSGR